MEKSAYEKLKDLRQRVQNGEPTTFAERNIVNMYNKSAGKKQPKKVKQNAARN